MIRVHDINNIYIPPQNVVIWDKNVALEDKNVALEDKNVALEDKNVALEDKNVALLAITEKPYEYKCDKCNKILSCARSLRRHISICETHKNGLICKYCNHTFVYRSTKIRHEEKCKKITIMRLNSEMNNFDSISKNNNTLITSSNIGILNNGTVNNNNINNGTVNNNTINITINNFGKEKLDHVNPAFIERCIRMGNHSGVYEIFRKISLNPNVPENHNVRICDERTQQLCVYKDNEWKLHKKNDILNEIIQVFNDLLINSYNQNEELQKEDIDKHNLKLRCILRDISHKHPIKEHANLCKRLFTSILELGVLQGFRLQMKLVAVNN
jgi:hypothetical protein